MTFHDNNYDASRGFEFVVIRQCRRSFSVTIRFYAINVVLCSDSFIVTKMIWLLY